MVRHAAEAGPAAGATPAPQRQASGSAKSGGAVQHTRGPPAAAVVATTTSNGLNVVQYTTQQPPVVLPPQAAPLQQQQPAAGPTDKSMPNQGMTVEMSKHPGQQQPVHPIDGAGVPQSAGPVMGIAVADPPQA